MTWPNASLPQAPSNPDFGRALSGGLAVIACYFNPCGYNRPKRNWHRFAEGLASNGLPLFAIELAFDKVQFFLPPGPLVTQLRSPHVLWHKERLLNLVMARVPPEFDKIAWVDADILFADPDWSEQASHLLDLYPVVQLFDKSIYLGPSGKPIGAGRSLASVATAGNQVIAHWGLAHPGFAWAARRELLTKHGFLDVKILGGGDSSMAIAMYGWWKHRYLDHGGPLLRQCLDEWMIPFWKDVQGQVGCVRGTICHLWHGAMHNRQYIERMGWLRKHSFDPRVDLRQSANGLWEWRGNKPELERLVSQYFYARREDGCC